MTLCSIQCIVPLVIDDEFWRLSSTDTISDIYDGAEYSRLSVRWFSVSSNPANISLSFNTDGVSLFHSSQTGIWSIYLVINELPRTAR